MGTNTDLSEYRRSKPQEIQEVEQIWRAVTQNVKDEKLKSDVLGLLEEIYRGDREGRRRA